MHDLEAGSHPQADPSSQDHHSLGNAIHPCETVPVGPDGFVSEEAGSSGLPGVEIELASRTDTGTASGEGCAEALSSVTLLSIISSKQSWAGDKAGHWETHESFVAEERRRRGVNHGSITPGRLFVSHCWRNPDSQLQKRRMVAVLSQTIQEDGPGFAYWGDWLDLQSDGPVPWLREIEEGIEQCSKTICFVDAAYLQSFNCLAEVAYALACKKPVVLLVLDQEAWELLTVPRGASKAWSSSRWGAPMTQYEGQEFPGGQRFTKEVVKQLFKNLSSINLCPCRDLDLQNWGVDGVLANMMKYITKDIGYAKEHATLQSQALHWKTQDEPRSLLLHRKKALQWNRWVELVDINGLQPEVTEEQRAFVQKSVAVSGLTRRRLAFVAALLLLLIFAGAIASAILAVLATEAEYQAVSNSKAAALWTMLGSIKEPQGTVYEMRALIRVMEETTALGEGTPTDGLRVESGRIFYKLLGLGGINSGLLSGNVKCWGVAWSPDGEYVAFSSETLPGNPVRIQSLSAAGQLEVGTFTRPVHGLAWHQDGRLAAADQTGDVHIWDLSGLGPGSFVVPEPLVLEGTTWPWEPFLPWTPVVWAGGAVVSSGGVDGSIRLWDLSTGTYTTLETSHYAPVTSIASSDQTGTLVSTSYEGAMDARHYLTSNASAAFEIVGTLSMSHLLQGTSLSPNGKLLGVSEDPGLDLDLRVVQASDGSSGAGTCPWGCGAVPVVIPDGWSEAPFGALTLTVRQQAVGLGWDTSSWSACTGCRRGAWDESLPDCVLEMYGANGTCPASEVSLWIDLTDTHRLAASNLGYTQSSWDATSPFSCCYGDNAVAGADHQHQGPNAPLDLFRRMSQARASATHLLCSSFSPDGSKLAAGSDLGSVVWQDLSSAGGAPIVYLPGDYVNGVAWSPDSRLLAITATDGTMAVWDMAPMDVYGPSNLSPHFEPCLYMAFNPQGTRLLSGADAGDLVHVYSWPEGELLLEAPLPAGQRVNYISVSPDGSTAALGVETLSGGVTGDGSVLLMDVDTGEMVDELILPEGQTWVNSVIYTDNGTKLIASVGEYSVSDSSYRAIVVWDLAADPEPVPELILHTNGGFPVRGDFSPDGRFIAAVTIEPQDGAPSFHLWDAESGQEIPIDNHEELFGHNKVSMQWSPVVQEDGAMALATGEGQENFVRVVYGDFGDVETLEVVMLKGHQGFVFGVSWTGDGTMLASAGSDGRLLIWDLSDPATASTLQRIDAVPPDVGLNTVAWSPDQKWVMVGGAGGVVVRVPFTPTADMPNLLRSVLLPFTDQEFGGQEAVELEIPQEVLVVLGIE